MEIDNYRIQRWMKGREIFSWFNLHYIFTLSRGLGSQSKEILIDKSSTITLLEFYSLERNMSSSNLPPETSQKFNRIENL